MISREEIDSYHSFIYPLAIRAGEILLEGYRSERKCVDIKSDFYDVVTDYDNKIEDFLIQEISSVYPDHKFISEEDTAKRYKNVIKDLTDAPTWIIDPIDGTSNFIKQIPHTCISIGLVVNKQIVLGLVNNPVQAKIYSAKLGQGAFCNDQPIHVSDCENVSLVGSKVLYEYKYKVINYLLYCMHIWLISCNLQCKKMQVFNYFAYTYMQCSRSFLFLN